MQRVADTAPQPYWLQRAARRRSMMLSPLRLTITAGVMTIVIFLAAPIVVVILTSLTKTGYLVFPPRGLSLRWYANIARNSELVSSFKTSLELAGGATVVAVAVATPAALALAHWRSRAAVVLEQLFLSPIILPAVVFGVAYLGLLDRVGLDGTFGGGLLAHVILATPFALRSILGGTAQLDEGLLEASSSLGASGWTTFRRITLPMLRSSILAGAVFAFIISFDEAVLTLFIVGPSFSTLPVWIFTYVQYSNDPSIAAVSTMLVAMSAVVMLVLGRTGRMTDRV